MRQKIITTLIIISLFTGGCSTTSKISTVDKTSEELRDLFVLTILTRDYLRNTNSLNFNVEKLMEYDSLERISENFEKIKFVTRGGHIAIQYKFSKKRDYKIDFTENEKQMKEIWTVKEIRKKSNDFDGEIQFEYGEKFYNFRKIIITK